MTTLTLSPTGQITLPTEVLQKIHWQTDQLVLLSVGDMLILRPAGYQKTDDKYRSKIKLTELLTESRELDDVRRADIGKHIK